MRSGQHGEGARAGRELIAALVDRVEAVGVELTISASRLDISTKRFKGDKRDIAELKKRSAEAIGYLAWKRPSERLPKLEATNPARQMPLSVSQASWCDVDQMPPEEQWLPFLRRFRGKLHVPTFLKAWRSLLTRQPSLRARYVSRRNGMTQEVVPESDIMLQAYDLSHLPEADREWPIFDQMKPFFAGQRSLEQGCSSLALYKLAPDHFVFAGVVHHVAMDAVGGSTFWGDLIFQYNTMMTGWPQLEALPFQYSDFIAWEQRLLSGDVAALSHAAWRHALADAEPVASSGGDLPEGWTGVDSGTTALNVPVEVMKAGTDFAQDVGTTFNVVFHTVVSLAMARMTGQKQALFTSLSRCRPANFERVIGCFMQPRPFYLSLRDDPTFAELIARAHKMAAAAGDIRRPTPPDLFDKLGFGRILLNFVAIPTTPGLTRPPPTEEEAAAAKAHFDAIFAKGDADAAPDGWRQLNPVKRTNVALRPAAQTDANNPEPNHVFTHQEMSKRNPQVRRMLGAAVEIMRLPGRLQEKFHRDMLIVAVQTQKGVRGAITFSRRKFSVPQVMDFTIEINVLLLLAIRSPEKRISELLQSIRYHDATAAQ